MGEHAATVFTIGHSVHPESKFEELLRAHQVTAVCDVRSSPYSRYAPQYSKDALARLLKQSGIAYVFLGRELGARSEDPTCYVDGRASYERIAMSDAFANGLERVQQGIESYRVALMCAEKDPLSCHRAILVAPYLRERKIGVQHILEDGTLEPDDELQHRLLALFSLPEESLFETRREVVKRAYVLQEQKIAFRLSDNRRSSVGRAPAQEL